ncbi:MAG: Hsp20/alpha crystallin family protein [Candidatus Wallbacteria bacterium]|nr:Hsp20/alpha crystallin family protein [Candidatus Wallbacteria bacterium]
MFDLIRRDPEFNRLFSLTRDLGRVFGADEAFTGATGAWLPPIDIAETETEMLVVCEAPGLTRDDIELSIVNNVLTLSGEKKAQLEDKGQTWHRVERHFGKFTRSFTLPRDVDCTKIQAKYNNGLLEIVLPKSAGAIPQKIQINGK